MNIIVKGSAYQALVLAQLNKTSVCKFAAALRTTDHVWLVQDFIYKMMHIKDC